MNHLALISSAALLIGCSDADRLPLLNGADRVEIGALKYVPVLAEITEPVAVERAIRFANSQRSQSWSTIPVKDGCRTISLTFYRGKELVGYFAWSATSESDLHVGEFVTHSAGGQARRPASREETASFNALLPVGFKPRSC